MLAFRYNVSYSKRRKRTMSDRQLSDAVRAKLAKLVQPSGLKFEELEAEYWRIYEQPFYQTATESLRNMAVINAMYSKFVIEYTTETTCFFYLGRGGGKRKDGSVESQVFDAPSKQIRKLMFSKAYVKKLDTLKPGSYFENMSVGAWKTGTDMFITPLTELTSTREYPISEVLDKISIPQITCASAVKNRSRLQSGSQYVDSNDWRMIEGFVSKIRTGNRKDGTPYGVVEVTDNSSLENYEIGPDGSSNIPKLTGWIDILAIDFDVGSIVKFYGPTSVKEGKTSMSIVQHVLSVLVKK